MDSSKKTKGLIMIIVSGCLWGLVGAFVKILNGYGISSNTIVFWRIFIAFIFLFIYLYFTNRDLLKIDKKGILYLAAMGFVCQTLFNIFYFTAIEKTTISTAVVLLYTSPIFVTIMSRIFYNELLTKFKILALIGCIIGCFLTVTGGSIQSLEFNILGILLGLGAGITYGSLPIFSKGILDKYSYWTIVLYMMGFGSLFIPIFSNPLEIFQFNYGPKAYLVMLLLSTISTVVPFTLYTTGLSFGIETSKAGIISTIEVVVAVIISFVFFNEQIMGWKLLGIVIVLLSVCLIQLDYGDSKINQKSFQNNSKVG